MIGDSPFAEVVSPVPRAAWQQVLRDDPGATAQQTPEYFAGTLQATGGRDASRLYTLTDGRRLVLPLVRRTPLPGLRIEEAYPPAYDNAGILATGGLRGDDVTAVVTDLRNTGAASIRLAGGHHTSTQWAAGRLPGVTASQQRVDVIDLSAGFDHLWQHQFHRGVRNAVRKAERAGVTVELDTTGRLLPVFYDIYLTWTDRRADRSGLPRALARRIAQHREPWAKFASIAAALGDRCRTFIAWHQGQPVAARIALVHGDHAIGWRSYSVRELATPVGANVYVHRTAIEDACRSGCKVFDLGQSSGVTGLHEFKKQLGAEPRSFLELRLERAGMASLRMMRERAREGVVGVIRRRSEHDGAG